MMDSFQNETIAAIATGQSPCAVGIIRVSGPQSLEICEKCLGNAKKLKPRMMHYRQWLDPVSGENLDDVMVCYFPSPRSYTGEDTVEIYGHGGPFNMARLLESLLHNGCRLAHPGEFTERAFLNGRMDLTSAEAVMSVINAQNERECREAHRQLSGSVSRTVEELRSSLLRVLVLVEASIDFSTEEDLVPLPVEEIESCSHRVLSELERIRRAHETARLQGYRVVLLGAPNTGKSSLFNEILGRERAIVTPIQGTTTDTIEEACQIDGLPIHLVDTAGLIHSENLIEQLGVQRSMQQAAEADFIIWLVDGSQAFRMPDSDVLNIFEDYAQKEALIILFNKIDSSIAKPDDELWASFLDFSGKRTAFGNVPHFGISVKEHRGIRDFEQSLARAIHVRENREENVTLVTSERHIALIQLASEAICRALETLHAHYPAECIAADLHDAADALAQITGAIVSDDILNAIFSQFCIGK